MNRIGDIPDLASLPTARCVEKGRVALSICIISHNGYGAICGGEDGFIGGVERQTTLLAKWLAGRGHDVSLVTWDEGGPAEEVVAGVRLIKICRRDAGMPVLRFIHPRWTGLTAALRRADADVYYHNCGEGVTGQIAMWCQRNGRPFVFSAASDADCDLRLPGARSVRDQFFYRYGLRRSDRIVVQTTAQQGMMRETFDLPSEVIPMPCPGPSDADFESERTPGNRVLWVGRVCRVKRPDRLLEIARACPKIQFDLVGPAFAENEYAQRVWLLARTLPNVTVHGAVSRDLMDNFYREASMLCCTSDYEGFPNTFLEAWSYGLPVVSTIDPDGVINRVGLGIVDGDMEELASGIRTLLDSPAEYRRISGQARTYYVENHTMDAVLPRVENLFMETAKIKNNGR